ncbi:ligand-binding sensor domain-containing protein [Arachidicoccus ginsenosidivorans]|nr:two-component regulator propeller domain-containing protein [Arachidicoccus ginsenosidivorans]
MAAFLRILLCCAIISIPGRHLFGQKRDVYIFKHISTESGLSNSTIECIFQDHSGLIWIGTRNGLNRIEGDHITNFYHDNRDSGTISNDYITDITEDTQHHLWLGTRNGINKLDLHKGFFHSVHIPNTSLPLIVNKIACDSSGYIWVATANNGLFKINTKNNKATSFANPALPSWPKNNTINTLYIDKHQHIWFSTPSGLFSYNMQTNGWQQWLDKTRLQEANIIKILRVNEHTLILGTEKTVSWFLIIQRIICKELTNMVRIHSGCPII